MKASPYEVKDIVLRAPSAPMGNPFFVHLDARFTGPAGESLRVPGFYHGDDVWKVRFAPTCEGMWSYVVQCPAIRDLHGVTGTVECERPSGDAAGTASARGVLRVGRACPKHFQFTDGTYFFMNAYECDWLWAVDLATDGLAETEALVDRIASYGFNTVLMNVYAHDSHWTPGTSSPKDFGPPAIYAWEGTNESPDHARLNLAFFEHFDSVIELLASRGIIVHLYLKVYNKKVNWPERYSPEEDLYFRYVLARYQAFSNMIWDFSKESFNEPDKNYLFNRISYMRSLDAYGHMVTTHDDHKYAGDRMYRGSIDFYTAQQHVDYYESAITGQLRYGIPYFNSEFGYEHGPGGIDDYTYGVRQSPEELIWRAWEVCMAGAYPAYYYTYTAWDVVDVSHEPPGYRYFQILYQFFSKLRFWELEPTLTFCRPRTARVLARGTDPSAADEFVVFHHARDRGGALVTEGVDLGEYDGEWLNIYTGETVPVTPDTCAPRDDRRRAGGNWRLTLPFEEKTGVLHLVKRM